MIHLPVETPTALTFGGPNLDVLFLTTGSEVLDFSKPPVENDPLSSSPQRGQTFMITGLGVKAAARPVKPKNYF